MARDKKIVMISAIIQARLGSTRLPGKTLMTLEDESLLGHLVMRVKASRFVNDIIIATTEHQRDDAIEDFAVQRGLKFYRGSEDDVLDRFYQAAVKFGAENIVRVTPDCPMLDPEVMDLVLSSYVHGEYDYVSNILPPTYPDGLDTEIFSFPALEKAWKESKLPFEREHVTEYIIHHPELFRLFNVEKPGDSAAWLRWTVDTKEDFEFAKQVFAKLYSPQKIFYMEDIVRCLDENPSLLDINHRDVQK